MIISHKHKFIFIKNRKTAGTSIEISLSKFCGPNDIITTITDDDEKVRHNFGFTGPQNYYKPKIEWNLNQWRDYFKEGKKPKKFYNHIPCKELIKLVDKKIWNSYFKFTIERNPFDKAVSYFFWRKGNEKYDCIHDFILAGGLNPLQAYDLYWIDKLPAVDKIYQYEDLAFLEKDLTKQLNLPEPFELINYKAKSHSRKIADYREILDEESIKLIKIAFAREIELFNYKF
jgi:hypothetical protein